MRKLFRSAFVPIIIANIVLFVLQLTLGSWFTEMFLLISSDILARPWILVSSMFLHASPTHLFFNMYVLFMFGPLVEQRIGKKRFYIIYFVSGILAALAASLFYERALGASGAIMGILGVTIMLLPDLKVLFLFFLPMSLRTAGIIFALVDLLGVFYPSGTANIAHLAGLGVGVAYGAYLLKKRKVFHKNFIQRPITKQHQYKKQGKTHAYSQTIELSEDDMQEYLKSGRL
jgi:uncharacterized protein